MLTVFKTAAIDRSATSPWLYSSSVSSRFRHPWEVIWGGHGALPGALWNRSPGVVGSF